MNAPGTEASGRARSAVAPLVSAVWWRVWLWPVTLREVRRMARARWWRSWPPLPLPDPDYWRFRMETAYGGDGEAVPSPREMLEFLRWCRGGRSWRRA